MSRQEWIALALEDAPEITPEQAAVLSDLLADARTAEHTAHLYKEAS